MQSFKDFLAVDYTPGMPDLVSYAAMKRKRGRIGESTQLDEATTVSRADFDKLKKGSMITIDYGSSITRSNTRTFLVKSKTRSAKYKVDKVNMVDAKSPGGMKFHLYSRQGGDATLALGDMGAVINSYSIKESVEEGSSAQSRLDRRAAKHGLGKKSDKLKKASDFFSKPPPSYSKDDLRKMGHPVESVDLSEKYEVVNVKHINDSGEDQAISYGRKKGYKDVGVIGDSPIKAMVLFQLKSEDKKDLKGAKIKGGEQVFRYATRSTVAGDIFPLIKVNLSKGIVYYLTQESSSGEIDEVKFETRGAKLKFARMISGVAESVKLDELSKGTLSRYAKKASADAQDERDYAQHNTKHAQSAPSATIRNARLRSAQRANAKADQRTKGVALAKKKSQAEDVSFSTAVKKKPVSQMTPAEKEKDAKRRKSYKDFQKGMRKGFKSLSASCKNEDANEDV